MSIEVTLTLGCAAGGGGIYLIWLSWEILAALQRYSPIPLRKPSRGQGKTMVA